jgi:hypothetical protein
MKQTFLIINIYMIICLTFTTVFSLCLSKCICWLYPNDKNTKPNKFDVKNLRNHQLLVSVCNIPLFYFIYNETIKMNENNYVYNIIMGRESNI